MEKVITILIAEDEEVLLKVISNKLIRKGFLVLQAHNGVECLKQAKEGKPDLILLDLIMPFKDGFEVLQELKIDKETKNNTPVVVFSNLGQESDVEKAKKLGASDFLIKSNVSIVEMLNKIGEYTAK
jgi:two-component system chemotaxis response regulator CheY